MIATDLSKQQALDADPKAIQQINFAENLGQGKNINYHTIMFSIISEAKETILDFSEGTVKVLSILSHDLARVSRVANVSDRKVFERAACSIILFCFNIKSMQNDSI